MFKKSIVLIFIAVFFASSVSFAKNFEIATGDWAPYVSKAMDQGGPTAQIVSEALKAAGHTATFQYMPWKRAKLLTQQGKFIATFPWSMSEVFKDNTFPLTPLAHQKMVFFFMKDKHPGWDFSGLENLKPFKMGGTQGYAYVEMFKNAGLEAVYADDTKASLNMMIHGRVDFVPESKLVGWQTINENYAAAAPQIASSNTPLFEEPLYLMIFKTHPQGQELFDAFEKGFKAIRENGTFKKILDKYGLSE